MGTANQRNRLKSICCRASTRCPHQPILIEWKTGQQEIRNGRCNSPDPPQFLIESNFHGPLISRSQVSIERLLGDEVMQCDHDLNGTCVNHIRDFGEVIMEQEDTICFDHIKARKRDQEKTTQHVNMPSQCYTSTDGRARIMEALQHRIATIQITGVYTWFSSVIPVEEWDDSRECQK
ncbi:hypothetical protein EGR_09439 [Echinococcus granulosus]|uniref:Uncharacterized protein n=1 Tax=Echinococcus granulosus TaxID=6210 RepID=W6UQH6_ECHGR|nr:hypothetical protein EGR_09439 [Echinococcus granulosus]EUB55679.1 hypothetical protein EGR_09439 [Echinococcus granulosus]